MPPRPPAAFTLDPRRLIGGLVFGMLWLEAMIVILDAGLHHGGLLGPDLGAWFDATSEDGLGSWVSITQTVFLALTAWGGLAIARATGASRGRVVAWALVAAAFSYLALDDGTMLHERVGSAFADTEASERGVGGAFPSYYWQLVLGPVFAAGGLFIGTFLWRELETARQRAFVAGAFALIAVAVALDFVDGLSADHPANVYAALATGLGLDAVTLPRLGLTGLATVEHASRAVEESLEMAAMTLLWAALLGHLARVVGGVTVRWQAAPGAPPEAAPEVGGDGLAAAVPEPPVPSTAMG